jgi:hypothetical protein
MSDGQDVLEVYDRAGLLVRSVPVRRDEHDATKWHLSEPVSLSPGEAESAVLRSSDGTSQPVAPSVLATGAAVHTLSL